MRLLHHVLAVATLWCVSGSLVEAARPAGSPNIIVIITDDQGYADAGYLGSQDIRTPHLDELAKSGVVCTTGYVTSAVCAPSRAGLLTGRYQQRTSFIDNAWSPLVGLSTDAPTIADILKAKGYATCAIGKWHMGQLPQFRPLVRGFTEHYGFLGGGRSFLPLKESQGVAFVPKDPVQVDLWRNTERGDDPPYVTDAFGDEAVNVIERHASDPFFLYLAFNAPHVPLQATDKYLSRFPNLTGPRRTYAAMLSAVDDSIGRIREALKRTNLERDTLIFFLSDNGGHPQANAASNKPLRGEKSTIYEGGIRVPFLVSWPGTLPANSKYDKPVSSLDIMATAVAIAGAAPPANVKLDGVNLIPYLKGDDGARPHETLYWRFINHRAIRHGDWKLTMPEAGPVELFDLSKDISESSDQSAGHPEKVLELKTLFQQWETELPPPGKVPRPAKPAA